MIGNRQIHSAIRLGLEETLRWRQNQEENFERKERELDREERDLQEERKELNEKIAAVQKHQEKAKHERGLLSDLEINRKRQIIFSGLQSENELLQERSIEYKKIEETLSQLPDSYRKAILSHHDHVRKDLEPVFSAMNTALPRSDLDLTAITLQIFTEPLPDEDISELVVILPVRFDRFLHWHDGDISLEDMLLFRINGALSGVLKKVGMPKSVIREEDFDGFVLLHLSIVSELNGDIKVALQSEIARINRHATEFQVAQISLDPVFLSSELIEFDDEETV
jgi:hypothetical protein